MDTDYVEPLEYFIRTLKDLVYLDVGQTKKRLSLALNYVLLLFTVYLIFKYGTMWFNGETRVNLTYNLTIYLVMIFMRFFLLLFKIRKESQVKENYDFYNEGEPVYTGVIPPNPTIEIKVTANPERVLPGNQIRYNLTITNVGNVPAKNLVVVNKIPDYTSFVSADNQGLYKGEFVSWNDIDLNPEESIGRSFVVYVDEDIDPSITEVINYIYFAYNQV